ncbi:MAG: amidohydrolase family protein [Marinoscillum sp.]|uniref:amidohydrolase family protein n=1 Tax=Marinoscillum sp. TaxID=2024838 RepID=UPI0032FFEEDA
MKRAAWIIFWMMISGQLLAQSPDSLLLKDYQPRSIFKIPKSKVTKARFPVIDMHSHPYARTAADLQQWIINMDSAGIRQTMILTYATGAEFDSLHSVYAAFGERFQLWCGFDYTGYNEPGWTEKAIKELERCHRKGAIGVGELGDKGLGLTYSHPTPARGMHINDPRMQPLLKRCGELGMPVNIHIAEPAWMYEAMDATNDGLMNGFKWRIDPEQEGILLHQALMQTLEEALQANPGTTFIACHFANCSADLSILTDLLDRYPNLHADISARYGETATIPRYMAAFYEKYQDRLLFGTDMGSEPEMYEIVFRILESEDEHFYQPEYFNYHWPLYGFGLSDSILKKLYYENAQKLLD